MNDRRFLELLNLYIDGEISRADVVDFENAVRSSAKHRATYTEYCRLHRATRAVCERFRAAHEAGVESDVVKSVRTAVLSKGEATIARIGGKDWHRRRPARIGVVGWSTGLAACAAIVLAVFSFAPRGGISDGGLAATAPAPEPASTVALLPEAPRMQPIPKSNVAPWAQLSPRLDPYIPAQTFSAQPNSFLNSNWAQPFDPDSGQFSPVSYGPVTNPLSFQGADGFSDDDARWGVPTDQRLMRLLDESQRARRPQPQQPSLLQPVGFELKR
jgi:hypothetical protein